MPHLGSLTAPSCDGPARKVIWPKRNLPGASGCHPSFCMSQAIWRHQVCPCSNKGGCFSLWDTNLFLSALLPTSNCPLLISFSLSWLSSCLWARVWITLMALPHPLVVENLSVFSRMCLNSYESLNFVWESDQHWFPPRLSGRLKGSSLHLTKIGCDKKTSSFLS